MSIVLINNVDLDALWADCADALCRDIEELASKRTEIVIAWPGGSSPKGLFFPLTQRLSLLSRETLSKLRMFQVDERLYDEHNQTMLCDLFFQTLIDRELLTEDQIFMFPLDLVDTDDRGLETYQQQLKSCGGIFNIVVLGTGLAHTRNESGEIVEYDCHVAGAFPHHVSTQSDAAKSQNFLFYQESPKPPPGRMTATLELIAKSEIAYLLVIGQKKQGVLCDYVCSEHDENDCPAMVVKRCLKRVLVTDREISSETLAAL